MSRVLPGVAETFARPLTPVNMFMSDDLPTLLRPMKAMSRMASRGTCVTFSELHTNWALVICILGVEPLWGSSRRKNTKKSQLQKTILHETGLYAERTCA